MRRSGRKVVRKEVGIVRDVEPPINHDDDDCVLDAGKSSHVVFCCRFSLVFDCFCFVSFVCLFAP